ncbi:MAG: hypothetical protein WBP61_06475, partial [Nocardioides sp.]
MTPPGKHRLFLDHLAPLAAFVIVVLASTVILVHVARSEPAPPWLRQDVSSVVAGGAPLTRHPPERAPA